MQHQVEEIVLLPTNEGRKQQNENDEFLRLPNNSNNYASDEHHRNVFKR